MSGQPPWHLWGNTQTFTIPGFTIQAGDASDTQTPPLGGQLCRVPYRRPDTFHFLLSAQLVAGPDIPANLNETAIVRVDFDLIVGIGRSSIVLPAFDEQKFQWTSLPAPLDSRTFVTSVIGRHSIVDGDPADLTVVDEITAQDIQLSCRVSLEYTRTSSDVPLDIPDTVVIVSAQFAPKTHIRPEWELEYFPGDEQGDVPKDQPHHHPFPPHPPHPFPPPHAARHR